MTRATAPAVAALAARTAQRRGTATSVVRISPVNCSAVKASTPRTATASCATGKPLKLSVSASGSGGAPAGGWAATVVVTYAPRALRPTASTAAMASAV